MSLLWSLWMNIGIDLVIMFIKYSLIPDDK